MAVVSAQNVIDGIKGKAHLDPSMVINKEVLGK